MEETKKYIVRDCPILHDHKLYREGDVIELTAKAAARLLTEKKLKRAKEESLEGSTKGEGLKDETKDQSQKGIAKGSTKGGKK